MQSFPSVLFSASFLMLPACGDKPDDSTSLSGGADTTAGSNGSTGSTDTTTNPDDTTASSSGSATTPTTGDTTETTGSVATTTGDTTGDPAACVALGAMECEDNAACQAIEGSKINLEKMCLGKSMFFACIPASGCDTAETVACAPDADPTEPFLFPTTCVPPDWQSCDAPMIDKPCK